MHYLKDVIGFLGPGCTQALDPVARLANYWNLAVVSGKISLFNIYVSCFFIYALCDDLFNFRLYKLYRYQNDTINFVIYLKYMYIFCIEDIKRNI